MTEKTVNGILLDENTELTLRDICNACSQHADWVSALVEEGVLEPIGSDYKNWRFSAISLQRARSAMRLERDLGINRAGIALVLDLLDELETLRARLNQVDIDVDT